MTLPPSDLVARLEDECHKKILDHGTRVVMALAIIEIERLDKLRASFVETCEAFHEEKVKAEERAEKLRETLQWISTSAYLYRDLDPSLRDISTTARKALAEDEK